MASCSSSKNCKTDLRQRGASSSIQKAQQAGAANDVTQTRTSMPAGREASAIFILLSVIFYVWSTTGADRHAAPLTEEWTALRDWMTSRGAEFHPGMRLATVHHAGFGVRGVVTNSALEEGTVVARIPTSLFFTDSSASKGLQMNIGSDDMARCQALAGEIQLAAAFALELRKEMEATSEAKSISDWRPYLRIMPTMEDMRQSHPFLAGEDVQALVALLPSLRMQRLAYLTRQRVSRGCFERWQQVARSPVAGISWEDMVYSYILMFTRTFNLRAPGGYHWTKTTFVPFLDMLNTVPDYMASVRWEWKDGAVQVRTLRPVAAGEELHHAYCTNCDNEHVLGKWGVYYEDGKYAPSDFHKANCSEVLGQELGSTFRQQAEAGLDLSSASQALKEGWAAPRCKSDLKQEGVLRCLLSRLAWEHCASDWGYEAWNKTKPKDPEARLKAASPHYNMAWALKNLGEAKEAERFYKASLRIKPSQVDVQYSFGIFLQAQNKVTEARKALQAAVKLEPRHQPSHAALARLLGSIGEFELGKKHIEIATRLRSAAELQR
eukprot:TRINITY_DN10199_c0_g3_i1.p1 TRINITY_DN10199_c0_g3~~TRINITY_DN10199_c0_g3_i1.p1  ORF type:complete len:551 (-),score=84.34 TRINITY_DN10199_c0_g3_i1:38-1690(-)